MKRLCSLLLGLALITGTSISPAYASEIEPRYSIETIEVELEVPATIPSQQLTDSTGRTVSFQSLDLVVL